MKIFSYDYSKFVKIGEEGYQVGQEQAKTYFPCLPESGEYAVEVEEPEIVKEIFALAGITDGDARTCTVSVDKGEEGAVYLTVVYYCKVREDCRGYVTSRNIANNLTKDFTVFNKVLDVIRQHCGEGGEGD